MGACWEKNHFINSNQIVSTSPKNRKPLRNPKIMSLSKKKHFMTFLFLFMDLMNFQISY